MFGLSHPVLVLDSGPQHAKTSHIAMYFHMLAASFVWLVFPTGLPTFLHGKANSYSSFKIQLKCDLLIESFSWYRLYVLVTFHIAATKY